ncbi:MAG: MerC mercury resistance protein [Verrucomicrobiaceae bacterium]|nr:MerC mercury resistance protein [Verrucomicrobiaceae bacterium]|tara:strand:+ start:276 stop:674 length:399 start_codon:yes stop_codon:yes gene_type:complete
MRITQEYSDKTAIGLSVLCLLHCLLVPTFLVFLSGYISLSYNNEIVHYILLLIAIPVSIYALIAGARNHKSINFLYLGFTGILFLILAVTLGAQIWGETGEKALTTLGALIVAISHFKNYRLCREVECDDCH